MGLLLAVSQPSKLGANRPNLPTHTTVLEYLVVALVARPQRGWRYAARPSPATHRDDRYGFRDALSGNDSVSGWVGPGDSGEARGEENR
jgi:hypothetical protein